MIPTVNTLTLFLPVIVPTNINNSYSNSIQEPQILWFGTSLAQWVSIPFATTTLGFIWRIK